MPRTKKTFAAVLAVAALLVAGTVNAAPASAAPPAGDDYVPVGGEFEGKQVFVYNAEQHYVYIRDGVFHHIWWGPSYGFRRGTFGAPTDRYIGRPVGYVTGDEQHYFARMADGKIRHFFYKPGLGVRQDDWASDASTKLEDDILALPLGDNQHLIYVSNNGKFVELAFFPSEAEKGVQELDWASEVPVDSNFSGRPTMGNTLAPSLRQWANNHMFVRNSAGAIVHYREDLNPDPAIQKRLHRDLWADNSAAGDPQFVSFQATDEHIFYVDSGGRLQHRFFKPGFTGVRGDVWNTPGVDREHSTDVGPQVFTWHGGQEHVLLKGVNGDLRHHFYDPGARRILHDIWAPAGSIQRDLSVLVMHNQQHAFYVDRNGDVQHTFWGPGMSGVKSDVWR